MLKKNSYKTNFYFVNVIGGRKYLKKHILSWRSNLAFLDVMRVVYYKDKRSGPESLAVNQSIICTIYNTTTLGLAPLRDILPIFLRCHLGNLTQSLCCGPQCNRMEKIPEKTIVYNVCVTLIYDFTVLY